VMSEQALLTVQLHTPKDPSWKLAQAQYNASKFFSPTQFGRKHIVNVLNLLGSDMSDVKNQAPIGGNSSARAR